MEVVLLEKARKDRDYWKKTGNVKIMKRITDLLNDIEKHPFTGIGKPEPLKGNLTGYWSRTIDEKNRLVYKIEDELIKIIQCKNHYDDK